MLCVVLEVALVIAGVVFGVAQNENVLLCVTSDNVSRTRSKLLTFEKLGQLRNMAYYDNLRSRRVFAGCLG